MYTVIFSNDPWLLARLSTELMLEGVPLGTYNEDWEHPFDSAYKWMFILYDNDKILFDFLCHKGGGYPKRITLTESNYLDTLKFLIDNKS